MRVVNHYISYLLCVSAIIFTGCDLLDRRIEYEGNEIRIFARIAAHLSVDDQTKGVVTSSTGSELGIGLVRLDDADVFVNCGSTPLVATLGTPNAEEGNLRSVIFDTPQFFPSNESKVTYAAWYPWPNTGDGYNFSSDENATTITFPITGDSDIMYSDVTKGSMSEGFQVMQFNHALSLFRIYVYSSTNDVNNVWGQLSEVSISGLPDVCTITLPRTGTPQHSVVYSNSQIEGVVQNLNLSFNPSSDIDIPIGFEKKIEISEWIAAPATASSGDLKKLDINVITSKHNTVSPIIIARDFKPGFAYDIVLRFSDNSIIDAEVKTSQWKPGVDINSDVGNGGIFYNLSAYGTANCYIVSSANFGYSFDATVKGNGNTDAIVDDVIDKTLDPKYVDIIWAEGVTTTGERPDFQLETNKVVEGKVLFKVNGNPSDLKDKSLVNEGNVLLGVYDSQGGNLLWTWHIWITDKPQEQNYSNGYVVLDRNLGATAASKSTANAAGTPYNSGSMGSMNGLFYQWGRPTPFHLLGGSLDATNSYTRVTPDDAVTHPKTFYGRYNSVADEAETPSTIPSGSSDYHDWVDRTSFKSVNNLWGYRRVEHERPIKTIYDPCPHGYHVPYSRNWESIDESVDSWINKPSSDKSSANYLKEWSALGGISLNTGACDVWYPFQGYINKDGVYKYGHFHMDGNNSGHKDIPIVELWSSLINRHDDDDEDTGTDELANDSPYRFLFNVDNGAVLSDSYSNRSRGLPVRCVSDNTADVVMDLSAYQTSNCYMIHKDGYYKFKATVRGNGVGSLLPLGGTTTAEINAGLSTTISPAKVDILWWQGDFIKGTDDFPVYPINSQDDAPENMCLTLLDSGELCEDGFVSFKISNFSKGNVILAAYDSKGSNAEILWTWHIWLTDKPEDKISGNYTKMDRFLGATYAPDINSSSITFTDNELMSTLGFYYQWGRKDPIVGPQNYTSADGNDNSASASGDNVKSSGWWKKGKNGKWSYVKSITTKPAASIPEVVKDPTAFYKSATESGNANSQWFSPSFADGYTNVALWGYAVADYSIQGQTFSKTMHDPCPPGYRTPFHHSWKYSDSEKYAEGEWGGGLQYLNSESSYNSYGIVTFKGVNGHFEKMWYPYAGIRNPLTGGCQLVGTEGHMNTGMPMRQYETRTFWYTSSQSGQDAGGKGSAYGMSIRCMKE